MQTMVIEVHFIYITLQYNVFNKTVDTIHNTLSFAFYTVIHKSPMST